MIEWLLRCYLLLLTHIRLASSLGCSVLFWGALSLQFHNPRKVTVITMMWMLGSFIGYSLPQTVWLISRQTAMPKFQACWHRSFWGGVVSVALIVAVLQYDPLPVFAVLCNIYLLLYALCKFGCWRYRCCNWQMKPKRYFLSYIPLPLLEMFSSLAVLGFLSLYASHIPNLSIVTIFLLVHGLTRAFSLLARRQISFSWWSIVRPDSGLMLTIGVLCLLIVAIPKLARWAM